jgi:invasion protein IalB
LPIFRVMLCACVGLASFATAAVAQKPAPAQPAPPASTEPTTTTASYGVWTKRCQTGRTDAGAELKLCQVEQAIVPQGQQGAIAEIFISRPANPKEEMRLTAVLPNNISFPSAPKITNGEKEVGTDLTWRRCLPGGCFADAVPKEDMLRNWRAETGENTGKLVFVDASGRTLTVQFSFRGFGQAMDALAKEK